MSGGVTTLPEVVVTAKRDAPRPQVPSAPVFAHKRLDITFTKNPGVSPRRAPTPVKLSGLRASATIIKAGKVQMGGLQLRLFGLTPSKMNDLSTLGQRTNQATNHSIIM